jgi:hypothetical protein
MWSSDSNGTDSHSSESISSRSATGSQTPSPNCVAAAANAYPFDKLNLDDILSHGDSAFLFPPGKHSSLHPTPNLPFPLTKPAPPPHPYPLLLFPAVMDTNFKDLTSDQILDPLVPLGERPDAFGFGASGTAHIVAGTLDAYLAELQAQNLVLQAPSEKPSADAKSHTTRRSSRRNEVWHEQSPPLACYNSWPSLTVATATAIIIIII